jgi:hypothetical protein
MHSTPSFIVLRIPRYQRSSLRTSSEETIGRITTCDAGAKLLPSFAASRGRQKTVQFAGARLEGQAYDLPAGIDGRCEQPSAEG